MRWVHTLIDYDNAKTADERKASDVAINLSIMVPALAHRVSSLIPDSQEMRCRLYGGWITLDGQTTFQAGWLLGQISNFRGRQGPLRARLALATELTCKADLTLIGTYRDRAQKMVDGMISVDLLTLAEDHESSLVLVSDDDDFVPTLIASAYRRPPKHPIFVLRRQKQVGSAPNDARLSDCAIVFAEY